MLGIKPFLLENLSETTGKNELPPKEEEWEELRFSDRLGNEKAAWSKPKKAQLKRQEESQENMLL